jgi:hypothetical protein
MDAKPAAPPPDDGTDLFLSAPRSAAYFRMAAEQTKSLHALTPTPSLKRYLGEMVARYEERAVDFEESAEVQD